MEDGKLYTFRPRSSHESKDHDRRVRRAPGAALHEVQLACRRSDRDRAGRGHVQARVRDRELVPSVEFKCGKVLRVFAGTAPSSVDSEVESLQAA
jgi:hypothetical protein